MDSLLQNTDNKQLINYNNEVLLSWNRCIDYEMSPNKILPKILCSEDRIKEKIIYYQLIAYFFDLYARKIKDMIIGEYVLLLYDKECTLLKFFESSSKIKNYFKKNGVKTGVSFEEESVGTTAISVCKKTQKPAFLFPEQHFAKFMKNFYTYAYPVCFDQDVSCFLGVVSEENLLARGLMAIVELLAHNITNECLRLKYNDGLNEYSGMNTINMNEKQLEVLKMSCKGYKEERIAKTLGVTLNTVKYHKKRIFKLLDVQSTNEAIFKALKMKIIKL